MPKSDKSCKEENGIAEKPYFQQLQQQFTQHIRNPDIEYQPENEEAIEPRRLKIYKELFFNTTAEFFKQIFPVCYSVLGPDRWQALMREYLLKHRAHTPLFHELGQEFLLFLQNEYLPAEKDPEFLFELAHYEWVELALLTAESDIIPMPEKEDMRVVDLDKKYQLSALAWPLAYEWPVHQISEAYQPQSKPEESTILLVYRNDSNRTADRVEFLELTPLL